MIRSNIMRTNRKKGVRMNKVSYETMYSEFLRVLINIGFTENRARLCAKLFAEASRDGVYTHGLNRFPRYIKSIHDGDIKINAEPTKVESFGGFERWDGNEGPGNLNAHHCMNRAIELAKENGIGCVALKNTNHWMRAGSYGLQAADAECIGICWTNTMPNMPPWGSDENKLGNNPIVFAVPREEGHILLDMAITMFSFGKLESHALNNEMLSVDGGYNLEGELTKDPHEIVDSKRALPIGYWKGSGFSLLLDLITTILSGGNSTFEIGKLSSEKQVSQTFITFDMTKLQNHSTIHSLINSIIDDLHDSQPINEGDRVFYPGERMLKTRNKNLEEGIPAEPKFWEQVLRM